VAAIDLMALVNGAGGNDVAQMVKFERFVTLPTNRDQKVRPHHNLAGDQVIEFKNREVRGTLDRLGSNHTQEVLDWCIPSIAPYTRLLERMQRDSHVPVDTGLHNTPSDNDLFILCKHLMKFKACEFVDNRKRSEGSICFRHPDVVFESAISFNMHRAIESKMASRIEKRLMLFKLRLAGTVAEARRRYPSMDLAGHGTKILERLVATDAMRGIDEDEEKLDGHSSDPDD